DRLAVPAIAVEVATELGEGDGAEARAHLADGEARGVAGTAAETGGADPSDPAIALGKFFELANLGRIASAGARFGRPFDRHLHAAHRDPAGGLGRRRRGAATFVAQRRPLAGERLAHRDRDGA